MRPHTIQTNLAANASGYDYARLASCVQVHSPGADIRSHLGGYIVTVDAREGGAILRDVVTALDHAGYLDPSTL